MNKLTIYNYNRKSTDTEDKQILSLESQLTEMNELAGKRGLKIDHYLQESKSAKKVGRPVFNQMIRDIKNSKNPCSIITWHPNRLTRNNPDMAVLTGLIDEGKILEIITPIQTYKNTPIDKFMFGFWCLQSKLDNDNKSIDIARGMKARAMKGFYPIQAPLGYTTNDAVKDNDKMKVPSKDFPLLKKALQMILNRTHTPSQVLRVLTEDWGVRSKRGNKITKSAFFKNFLKNPFIYGEYEFPKGSGQWMKGSHKPMISKYEWQEIQDIIEGNRTSKVKPQKQEFSFGNGMVTCGECGSKIISYNKTKKQKNGITRHYVYNECKGNKACTQKCTENQSLHFQLMEYLNLIEIPEEIHKLAMSWVKNENQTNSKEKEVVIDNLTKRYKTTETLLDGLIDMKAGGEVTKEKYDEKYKKYTEERDELKRQIDSYHEENTDWLDLVDKMFTFAEYAKKMYQTDDVKLKRAIIRSLGSNLTLKDKKLEIERTSWIYPMQEIIKEIKRLNAKFEPVKNQNAPNNRGFLVGYEYHSVLWAIQDSNL